MPKIPTTRNNIRSISILFVFGYNEIKLNVYDYEL